MTSAKTTIDLGSYSPWPYIFKSQVLKSHKELLILDENLNANSDEPWTVINPISSSGSGILHTFLFGGI